MDHMIPWRRAKSMTVWMPSVRRILVSHSAWVRVGGHWSYWSTPTTSMYSGPGKTSARLAPDWVLSPFAQRLNRALVSPPARRLVTALRMLALRLAGPPPRLADHLYQEPLNSQSSRMTNRSVLSPALV